MGINGINDYYSPLMQSYRLPSIPSVDVQEVREAERRQAENPLEAPVADTHEQPVIEEVRKPDAAIEDVSLTFNKQEDFGYIGQDKDINALDMEKAISDMRKDQVLQQYQYFVGSARNLVSESADGRVIAKF